MNPVSWSFQHRAALILAIALLVNVNTLTNGWALDDTLLITRNSFTRQGVEGIPAIWSHDVFVGYLGQGGVEPGGRYRPLSQTVFALQFALVGERPWLGHVTNVLLYALTCGLLFAVLSKLRPEGLSGAARAEVPFFAALLFAVHPVHAEVVANIKSLDEILALLFALLTVLFAVRAEPVHGYRYHIPACLTYFLALTAKENAITFLGIVPLVSWYTGADRRRTMVRTAWLLAPVALYLLLRAAALGPAPERVWQDGTLSNPFHGATSTEHLATASLILLKNIKLLVFPWPLTTDYYPREVPIVDRSDPRAVLGAVFLVAGVAYALVGVRHHRAAAFGVLWTVITWSVVSNVFVNLGTPLNDRFLFMPSAGYTYVFAVLVLRGAERARAFLPAGTGRALLLVVLMAYASGTVLRNRDWKDDLTLFAHDVRISDRSARCHVMYAKLLLENPVPDDAGRRTARLREAREHLDRGLAIHPDYALAHGLLGKLAMDQKDYHEATVRFIACLERDSTEAVALKNLAFIGRRMGEAGDHAGAERAFRAAIRFDPRTTEPYLFLADALMRTGRADSALMWLDRLLVRAPNTAAAYRLKGEVYAVHRKDAVQAEANFLRAHALAPNDFSVLDNLAVSAYNRRDLSQALSYLLQAVEREPGNSRRLRNVAELYRLKGQPDQAAAFEQRALASDGRSNGQP